MHTRKSGNEITSLPLVWLTNNPYVYVHKSLIGIRSRQVVTRFKDGNLLIPVSIVPPCKTGHLLIQPAQRQHHLRCQTLEDI